MLLKLIDENYKNKLNNYVLTEKEKKEIEKYFDKRNNKTFKDYLITKNNTYIKSLKKLMETGYVNNEIIVNNYIRKTKYHKLISELIDVDNSKNKHYQLTLPQIDVILSKETAVKGKYYRNENFVTVLFKTQSNIMKSKNMIPNNSMLLSASYKNTQLDYDDIEKLILELDNKDHIRFGGLTDGYKNIIKNLKINKEILEKILKKTRIKSQEEYNPNDFKKNVILKILHNLNIDDTIINFLIEKYDLTMDEIKSNLIPSNKNIEDFIKEHKENFEGKGSFLKRLIKNDNDLEKNYKEKNIDIKELIDYVRKNRSLFSKEKVKDLFKNEYYRDLLFNEETTSKEISSVFDFENFENFEKINKYFEEMAFYKHFGIKSNLKNIIRKCNLNEDFIKNNLMILHYYDSFATKEFAKDKASLIQLGETQYLPNFLFGKNQYNLNPIYLNINIFLEECFKKERLDVATKQIRNFDNYKVLLSMINNKNNYQKVITSDYNGDIEEEIDMEQQIYKTQLVIGVLNNNNFLSKISKNELTEILTEIKNIDLPIKVDDEILKKISLAMKEIKELNLKTNEFRNNNSLSF